MDEIDMIAFFKELTLNQDVENFIKHKKVPAYVKTATNKQYTGIKQAYPLMDDPIRDVPCYDIENYTDSILCFKKSVNKCDDLIRTMTEQVPEVECCPVCYTEFEDNNYVVPKCKHKVCAICFTHNIKHNKYSGDCCVLCRKKVC